MPRIGLIGPSYTPYSTSVETQRTANFYPERVESGKGKNDYSLFGTPGLANHLTLMIASIVGGGTIYTAGDVLTVVGGTGTAATLTVSTVAAGVITAITVTTGGFYSVFPTSPVSVTGGTGTGATFTLLFGAKVKAEFYEPLTSRLFAAVRMTDTTSRLIEFTLAGGQTDRGEIKAATAGSNPVSISSNGLELFIVEGAESYFAAFSFMLATNVLTNVTASVGNGEPIWGDFLDQYFIALDANGKFYISALLDGGTWDALDVAEAESSPDRTKMIKADHGELWQFGTESIEPWFNSGNEDFPFEPIEGQTIQSGLAYQFSIVALDNAMYWVGRAKNGAEIVYRSEGYQPVRISTYAVEQSMQQKTVTGISPIAFGYQQFGHSFYVLTYPDDNLTWVYDAKENMWHERMYLNGSTEEAWRGRCHCFAGGVNAATAQHFIGDRANGRIYTLRMDNLDDFGNTIRRIRRSPHIFSEGEKIPLQSLQIDGEFGLAAQQRLKVRWSYDGGKTFKDYKTVDVGTAGGRGSGATVAAIVGGGTVYTASDLLTVVGGTGTATTIRVLTVAAGVIATVEVETPGSYTVNPTNPVSVTGGTGTGATFTLTIETQYYRNRAIWRRLRNQRDGVVELMVEDSVKWVLTDAYVKLRS